MSQYQLSQFTNMRFALLISLFAVYLPALAFNTTNGNIDGGNIDGVNITGDTITTTASPTTGTLEEKCGPFTWTYPTTTMCRGGTLYYDYWPEFPTATATGPDNAARAMTMAPSVVVLGVSMVAIFM